MKGKKKYVLWVVHTNVGSPIDVFDKKISWDPEFLELSQHFIEIGEKIRKKLKLSNKDFSQIHREGIIAAMKIAQEAGIVIVYESGAKGGDFLVLASREGVNYEDIIRMPFFRGGRGKEAVHKFFEILEEKGITDFETIFAGHYADVCIYERAKELRNSGFRPYLIVGTPVRYAIGRKLKKIREFFGPDRLIIYHDMKKLQ